MTVRFAEGAARLAGIVPRLLGWLPDTFWNATPSELAAILAPPASSEAARLTRGELDRLLEQDRHERSGKR